MNSKPPSTSTFIRALYNLTRKGTPYVDWSADGTTFRILDVKRFASEVLPQFFKHNNMASFQRQLNYFSFKKWTKNNRTMGALPRKSTIAEFHHPSFTRDMDESLLPHFRRKTIRRSFEPLMDVYANGDDVAAESSADRIKNESAEYDMSSKSKTKKGRRPSATSCLLPMPDDVGPGAIKPSLSTESPKERSIAPPVIQFEPISFNTGLLHGEHHCLPTTMGSSMLRHGTCLDHAIDISWGQCDAWQAPALVVVAASGNDNDWLANFDWEAHGDIIATAGVLCQEPSADGVEADNASDMIMV